MTPSPDGPLPRLTAREVSGLVAFSVALFLVVGGPVWRHPWRPDGSILWSYVPIPFLVAAVLKATGKLRLAAVLADSLLVALFKFGITASILIALWSFGPAPPARGAPENRGIPRGSEESRAALKVNTEGNGARATAGSGCAGAAALQVGAGRIAPAVLHLRRNLPVCISSADGRLHAIELIDAQGVPLANVPILASGSPRVLSFEEISRAVSVRCTVHPAERANVE